MEDQPEVQTFVRKEPDGTEQVHRFAPWPEGPVEVQVMLVQVAGGDGDGELRHLSYDDPPVTSGGRRLTPEEYRQGLAQAVACASSEADFTEKLVAALARDMVLSHGVKPDVAVAAASDFARKVYAEFAA